MNLKLMVEKYIAFEIKHHRRQRKKWKLLKLVEKIYELIEYHIKIFKILTHYS